MVPGSYMFKSGKIIYKVESRVDELGNEVGLTLDTYRNLRRIFKGKRGIEIHHLIEKRFAKISGVSSLDILSIPLSKELHKLYTSRWRNAIGYGWWNKPSKNRLIQAISEVYYDNPQLLSHIRRWLRRNGLI